MVSIKIHFPLLFRFKNFNVMWRQSGNVSGDKTVDLEKCKSHFTSPAVSFYFCRSSSLDLLTNSLRVVILI